MVYLGTTILSAVILNTPNTPAAFETDAGQKKTITGAIFSAKTPTELLISTVTEAEDTLPKIQAAKIGVGATDIRLYRSASSIDPTLHITQKQATDPNFDIRSIAVKMEVQEKP